MYSQSYHSCFLGVICHPFMSVLKCMDEILWFNHSNETPLVELLPSTM